MKHFILILLYFLIGGSCGLANLQNNSTGSVNNSTAQNSQSQSRGTWTSSAGRLTSKETCSDSSDCVEMCDSMLNRLSLQKDCYEQTAEEVQALRDTYNHLAKNGGDPRSLSKVEPDAMENFLKFSPKLYRSAIYGFRRGWKEGCTVVSRSQASDPRDREDCKLKDYYQQDGYHSGGAAHALEWIAGNNWLAELLLEYDDEDHIIMLSLLDVLANGGKHPVEDIDDAPGLDDDKNGNPARDGVCKAVVPSVGICPFAPPDGSATEHGRLLLESTPADTNQPTTTKACDWDKNKGMNTGRNWPSDATPNVADDFANHWEAFGADCVSIDSNRKNYFMIAVKADNPHSANLGHQVLREKLCDNDHCQRYFYCTIQDDEDDQIITYMKAQTEVKNFSSTLHNCP